jgi:hypothetical protein
MQGRVSCLLVMLALSHLAVSQRQPSPLQVNSDARPIQMHLDAEIHLNCIHLDSGRWRTYPGQDEFYVQEELDRYVAVSLKGECRPALNMALVQGGNSLKPSDLHIVDLADRERGGVIAVVVRSPDDHTQKPGILVFNPDGSFNRLTFIEGAFFPTHVAEFSSGAVYVVTGYDEKGAIYQALVTSEGRILKPDVLRDREGPPTAKDPAESSSPAPMNAALIQLVSGDDDAVYLYNAARGKRAYRIRSDGTFTVTDLEASAPPPGEKTLILGMFISHRGLYLHEALIDESEKTEQVMTLNRFLLTVYDRYSGALQYTYLNDAAFGGNPMAMAPREFYFLKSKALPDGALDFSLVRAVP